MHPDYSRSEEAASLICAGMHPFSSSPRGEATLPLEEQHHDSHLGARSGASGADIQCAKVTESSTVLTSHRHRTKHKGPDQHFAALSLSKSPRWFQAQEASEYRATQQHPSHSTFYKHRPEKNAKDMQVKFLPQMMEAREAREAQEAQDARMLEVRTSAPTA